MEAIKKGQPPMNIVLSSPLPLDQNPARVYIGSLTAESGKKSQDQALRAIAFILHATPDTLDWSALRYQHTAAIRSKLAQVYAPATANKILSALRQTLKQAWLLGQMPAEDYRRAIELDPITGETLPSGRELSQDELKALLDVCKLDESPSGKRDAALIAVMYSAMLRREEAATLTRDNISGDTLEITGKRNKQRTAYLTNGTLEAMNNWLAIRGNDPGNLFVRISKSGKLGKSLTARGVYSILITRGKQAGLEHFSAHDFRRTGATNYLAAGVDVITVSKLGGWKNVQTLKRYDKRDETAKREAANLLSIPY
jgi:integrase/recombinase XerC